MSVRAPRGTNDLIATDKRIHVRMEELAGQIFGTYGFDVIETPIFEQTDVFVHGIGQATDVVAKEMFTVLSPDAYSKVSNGEALKADQELSLRPEGTASVVRALIQHNLLPQGGSPVKLWYSGSMFRAERAQKGRYRQFHQIGAEYLGAEDPLADAETIVMLMQFFETVGIDLSGVRLLINSMGDDACRPAFRESVKAYILQHADELCDECNRRAHTNPLRAFDCKNEHCQAVMKRAPKISDALCDECAVHYQTVKSYLDMAGVQYEEDPRLVRGLDYYTRTVFEVQVLDGLGAQNAIGGGGRYDKLIETVGGKSAPGLGFAVGIERIAIALENQGEMLAQELIPSCYIATVDSSCKQAAFDVSLALRRVGISCELDAQNRSLKSQFKLAGKLGTPYCVVVGPDELKDGEVTLRDMNTKSEQTLAIDAVAPTLQQMLA